MAPGVRVSHKTGHGVKLGGAGVAPASNGGGGGVDGDYQLVQHEVSIKICLLFIQIIIIILTDLSTLKPYVALV